MFVITGASDGLGLELAKLYKAAGKKVVNISRRQCKYADENILVDLREGTEIEKAAKAIAELDEQLEALINCAGVLSMQPLGQITEDEIKRVMSTNVKAPILLVSGLIDRIKKDGTDIVNVTSTSIKGYEDLAVYGSSKMALHGFSLNLRTELKNTPCRVIDFCPGGFQTQLRSKFTGDAGLDLPGLMPAEGVAKFLLQILDLPKNMEVSEVIVNRKVAQ